MWPLPDCCCLLLPRRQTGRQLAKDVKHNTGLTPTMLLLLPLLSTTSAPQVAHDTAAKPDATVVVTEAAGGSDAKGGSEASGGSAEAAAGGSADAAGALLSELSLSDWVRLDTCVTVVDASVFLDNLHSIEELRDR